MNREPMDFCDLREGDQGVLAFCLDTGCREGTTDEELVWAYMIKNKFTPAKYYDESNFKVYSDHVYEGNPKQDLRVGGMGDPGVFALFHAVRSKDVEMVRCLCRVGVNPNHKNPMNDNVPLQVSAFGGNEEICKILLDFGADPDIHDFEFRETALHLAAGNGHLKVYRLLIEAGANQTIKDKWGAIPADLLPKS